jgi:hypothetical protein
MTGNYDGGWSGTPTANPTRPNEQPVGGDRYSAGNDRYSSGDNRYDPAVGQTSATTPDPRYSNTPATTMPDSRYSNAPATTVPDARYNTNTPASPNYGDNSARDSSPAALPSNPYGPLDSGAPSSSLPNSTTPNTTPAPTGYYQPGSVSSYDANRKPAVLTANPPSSTTLR